MRNAVTSAARRVKQAFAFRGLEPNASVMRGGTGVRQEPNRNTGRVEERGGLDLALSK